MRDLVLLLYTAVMQHNFSLFNISLWEPIIITELPYPLKTKTIKEILWALSQTPISFDVLTFLKLVDDYKVRLNLYIF